MSVWDVFFGWPGGGVWSNLVASVLTGVGIWLRAKAKLTQARDEDREATQTALAEHRQAITEQLADHHQAVLAAVAPKEAP
jgi:hypothetical protein